jgi:hypothetical protein
MVIVGCIKWSLLGRTLWKRRPVNWWGSLAGGKKGGNKLVACTRQRESNAGLVGLLVFLK